jgi:SAM-dependent methyltransferase
MPSKYSNHILDILVCPYCKKPLELTSESAKCSACKEEYAWTASGALDLRLRRKKLHQLQFEIGTKLLPKSGFEFNVLQENPIPEVDFSDAEIPHHLSKELMSYFPKAKRKTSLMLDLGCGNTVHRKVCEYAGFEYVGLDYNNSHAPILGDAHALPFEDNSFEFILSIAVLEHIRFPFVMMSEVYRVLEPKGTFIGSVAFLEPFHGDSFYHHTHLGIYNSLQYTGFEIDRIAPNENWSVLIAQSSMALFPKMPLPISKAIVMPIYLLHKAWWKLGFLITHSKEANEKRRILTTAGSFFFIVHKPRLSEKQLP